MIDTIEKKSFVEVSIPEGCDPPKEFTFPNMLIGKQYNDVLVIDFYHVSTYLYNGSLLSEYHFELLGYYGHKFIATIPTPQFKSDMWYDLIFNTEKPTVNSFINFTLIQSNKIYPEFKLASLKLATIK